MWRYRPGEACAQQIVLLDNGKPLDFDVLQLVTKALYLEPFLLREGLVFGPQSLQRGLQCLLLAQNLAEGPLESEDAFHLIHPFPPHPDQFGRAASNVSWMFGSLLDSVG